MVRVIFFVVLILKIIALDIIKRNTCITPYKENGTCLPLFSCDVISSALDTLTPQALKFAKDSRCGCDMGMVCCGTFYNESYSPLVNCTLPAQLTVPNTPSTSDKAGPNATVKETDLLKGKSCVTPYGENATCVPQEKCAVISSALFKNGDRGRRFFEDSKCGCDAEMVCCGKYNNKSYTPLIDCATPPQPEKILLSLRSDSSICGLDSSTDKIKGGGVVKFEEHPWIAALEYLTKLTKESAGFRCGGSVITNSFILTAAHCIVHVEFMITKVWLGVTNTSTGEYCRNIDGNVQCIHTVQKLNVKRIIPHEFYNSIDQFHDIGLIEVEKPIEFSRYVRPICIPSKLSELPRIGTYLTVAGWGTTENGKSSEIKLKVEVPLKHNNVCSEYLKNRYQEITPKQLCVGGERGKDSCQGDSGGPLMYEFVGVNHDFQWFQPGIVSYGAGCGIQGRPGVYTKVSAYEQWINNKMLNITLGVGRDEPCTTINGTIGQCVPITTCEAVYNAVFTKNMGEFDPIKDLYCDVRHLGDIRNDEETLVCCENPGSIIVPHFNSTALPDKTTCGILKNEPRIDGTEIKDLAEYPWVAGIESFFGDLNATRIRCIGTVISSRYVLTAADCTAYECVPPDQFVPVNVWLGHWNTSAYNDCREVNNTLSCTDPVQKIKIKTTIKYPFLYDGCYDNIALFLLENEIRFSDYISPICLPLQNLPNLELGARFTVLIWPELTKKYTTGKYPTQFITTSDMMLREEISLVSNDKCNSMLETRSLNYYGSVKFFGQDLLTSLDLCAGGEGKHHCNRLLGAPLIRSVEDKPSGRMQWYLEGVVNYIDYYECTTPLPYEDYPGSYIRVSKYLDWIINIITEDS